MVDWLSQLSTATKVLIGGGIALVVLFIMCSGGLALLGPGQKNSGMSASEKISFARKCIQTAQSNQDLAVNMLQDKVTGPLAEWDAEEVADVMLALSDQEKPVFSELLTKCREEHEAKLRQADANWARYGDEIEREKEREKERQHELEMMRAAQAAGNGSGWSDAGSGEADPWAEERAALDRNEGGWSNRVGGSCDSRGGAQGATKSKSRSQLSTQEVRDVFGGGYGGSARPRNLKCEKDVRARFGLGRDTGWKIPEGNREMYLRWNGLPKDARLREMVYGNGDNPIFVTYGNQEVVSYETKEQRDKRKAHDRFIEGMSKQERREYEAMKDTVEQWLDDNKKP